MDRARSSREDLIADRNRELPERESRGRRSFIDEQVVVDAVVIEHYEAIRLPVVGQADWLVLDLYLATATDDTLTLRLTDIATKRHTEDIATDIAT